MSENVVNCCQHTNLDKAAVRNHRENPLVDSLLKKYMQYISQQVIEKFAELNQPRLPPSVCWEASFSLVDGLICNIYNMQNCILICTFRILSGMMLII